LRASPLKTFVTECPTKYQNREKLPGRNKLTVGAGCPKINSSLLKVLAVMLTGVTVDDIFRIAVARHFGKF
jgi:hypothetical protein